VSHNCTPWCHHPPRPVVDPLTGVAPLTFGQDVAPLTFGPLVTRGAAATDEPRVTLMGAALDDHFRRLLMGDREPAPEPNGGVW
jgi:hypothetical protein